MVLVTTDVLKVLSNEDSLELFRIVALTKPDTASADIIKSKTKLTRKQYYSRMSSLMKVGLIKRKQGKHTLTAFGKVVYNIVQMKIENAGNYYWKLKAIDSLEDSNDLLPEERRKFIDNLIDNHEIKAILVSDTEKENKNNKLEYDQPLLNMEQQQKQTNQENKKGKLWE
jgi:predicted transcriptional regulator